MVEFVVQTPSFHRAMEGRCLHHEFDHYVYSSDCPSIRLPLIYASRCSSLYRGKNQGIHLVVVGGVPALVLRHFPASSPSRSAGCSTNFPVWVGHLWDSLNPFSNPFCSMFCCSCLSFWWWAHLALARRTSLG